MGTREQLLEAALNLFQINGYEKTGVQSIVDAVGVGKPTLYYYFGSKKGLLESLVQENFESFWPDFATCCKYEHDIKLNLEAIIRCCFSFASQNPTFYRWFLAGGIYAAPNSEESECFFPLLSKQWGMIEELFLACSQDHGNMQGREERYAITFLGMVNTWILASYFRNEELTSEEIQRICHQFMHGIFS
jgi:TetR/AcrR family transcriptional regulator